MENPSHRSWRQRLVLGAGALATTMFLLLGVAAGYGLWKLDHIERIDVELEPTAQGAAENYLIVGSDSRAKVAANDPNKEVLLGDASDGQRSDTIMVVRVDPQRETVEALSVPRDLWVDLPTSGKGNRINSAYSVSPQELINAIRDNLAIDINHYIEIDFSAFKKIVDSLGGVPVWFDVPMPDLSSGI